MLAQFGISEVPSGKQATAGWGPRLRDGTLGAHIPSYSSNNEEQRWKAWWDGWEGLFILWGWPATFYC